MVWQPDLCPVCSYINSHTHSHLHSLDMLPFPTGKNVCWNWNTFLKLLLTTVIVYVDRIWDLTQSFLIHSSESWLPHLTLLYRACQSWCIKYCFDQEEYRSSTEAPCKSVLQLNTDTVQLALISKNHKLNVYTDALKMYLHPLKPWWFHPHKQPDKMMNCCFALP